MKISYEKGDNAPEPVAYIDCYGDLIVYEDEGDGILFPSERDGRVVSGVLWDPKGNGVKHLLYKGDSVTITF